MQINYYSSQERQNDETNERIEEGGVTEVVGRAGDGSDRAP
jgi:hypothetical protein